MTNDNLLESYGTLSQTINGLMAAGYNLDLNVKEDCLICHKSDSSFSPEEFKIDKLYRFEGATNPEDESIVYAISSQKFNIRGVLVNGYGPSADEATSKLVDRLATHN